MQADKQIGVLQPALYRCKVMHNRLAPKKHRFHYSIFMFWLDIDKIEETAAQTFLFNYRKRGIYRFLDSDHFKFPKGDARNAQPVRKKLNDYLHSIGVQEMPEKVFLLTHVRLFGHVFNPVSFYYCYAASGNCTGVVTEISNTFGEMKLFYHDARNKEKIEEEATKYFYVSPFTDMDTDFLFRYHLPDEKLNIRIDVRDQQGERFFISTLTGTRKTMRGSRLLWYLFRFPFITLQVIGGIHWEAFKLWLKKVPWHKKGDNPELQKGITNR
ncbi:MAG: DUF1365 domain-containing protein [Chitinophagales bacterium]